MEEKKTWAVGAGSGIGWLKALLVSYLISVLLLLLLSFLLWKFSWKESWVQAGIVVIYLASSFSGGRMAGNMAGKRRFLWGICFGIVYYGVSNQWSTSNLRVLRFNEKGEFTIMQVGFL